ICIVFLIIFSIQFVQIYKMAAIMTNPYERFKEAGRWLKENTIKNEIVYNVSWSDFPQLFYWNNHNTYVCGLDPNFILRYDEKLAQTYFNIASGIEIDIKRAFSSDFPVRFILVSKTTGLLPDYHEFHKAMRK